jgi:hypothetical protein
MKAREESIERKRRQFERMVFEDVPQVQICFEDGAGLTQVTPKDISPQGFLFEVPYLANMTSRSGGLLHNDIKLRFYFTSHTFASAVLQVRHAKKVTLPDGRLVMQYGGEFDRDLPGFKAVSTFIDFIFAFAEYSSRDDGDLKAVL